MRLRLEFSEAPHTEVEKSLHQTTTKEGYQRVRAVWLRMKRGLHAAEIAQIFGIHEASVWWIHSRYFKYGAKIFDEGLSGGRRHENLSPDEEAAFLKPYIKRKRPASPICCFVFRRINYPSTPTRRIFYGQARNCLAPVAARAVGLLEQRSFFC